MQAPVRVGGNIATPRKITDAAPVPPDTARQADVTGIVILEITVGTDGAVRDAKVLRSIPLLDAAAIDTVRQWRYEPTLLQGHARPRDHDSDGELSVGEGSAVMPLRTPIRSRTSAGSTRRRSR